MDPSRPAAHDDLEPPPPRPRRGGILPPLLGALLALLTFWAVGVVALRGYVLDLGSIYLPMPLHIAFLAVWGVFGGLAAAFLAVALLRLPGFEARMLGAAPAADEVGPSGDRRRIDRRWMAIGAGLALLLPLGIRLLLLRGAPLTDDESSYRFMAELLARGRLWIESPPLPLFFDRGQMVNDGRLYAWYFVGWPALLVPGLWLGLPGLMNPLYSALTVPALFSATRRLAGSRAARAVLLLFLGSPFLLVGAATLLSHTSCLFALTWAVWFFLRGRDADAPVWAHFGLGLAFSIAFFVRPQTALGIGLPLLVVWLMARLRERRLAPVLAFALPSLVLAGLFLGANRAQTGDWLEPAYQRAIEYAAENDFRFAAEAQTWDTEIAHLRLDRRPLEALGHVGIGVFRLNFALFGWACSLLFALLALGAPRTGLWWTSVATFLALHLWASDPGIDSWGPVHYSELALPLLLLSGLGFARARRRLGLLPGALGERLRALPAALLVALVVTAWLGYVPVRLYNLQRIAENVNLPRDTVAAAGLERAVVFAPWPFAPNCLSFPTQHHVRFRPNNDPWLRRDVLWVNHLDVERNRELMEHFPDRRGWVMLWTEDCRVALLPLDRLDPGDVPPGRIRREPRGD